MMFSEKFRMYCKYFACYFHENMNHCLVKYLLPPANLRLANVAPVY